MINKHDLIDKWSSPYRRVQEYTFSKDNVEYFCKMLSRKAGLDKFKKWNKIEYVLDYAGVKLKSITKREVESPQMLENLVIYI